MASSDVIDKRDSKLLANSTGKSSAFAIGFKKIPPLMPTKYIHVQGHAIYVHYAGATTLPDVMPEWSRGRKIVFVHAAGSNGHSWHYQLEHVGLSHSPIALDLPGHGRSSGVEGMKTVQAYTDFIAAFMDSARIDSAVIAGRSMGGAIAMDFALRYARRAQALVLIATAAKFNLIPEMVASAKEVAAGRAPQAFVTAGFAPRTIAENFNAIRESWSEQVKTDPRVRYSDLLACEQADLRSGISGIKHPVLILAGADDQSTPVRDAEFIKYGIPHAQLEIVADAAHNIPTEKPDFVNAAIEQFLGEIE